MQVQRLRSRVISLGALLRSRRVQFVLLATHVSSFVPVGCSKHWWWQGVVP